VQVNYLEYTKNIQNKLVRERIVNTVNIVMSEKAAH